MDRYNPVGMSKEDWIMSNPTVIDYHHQVRPNYGPETSNVSLPHYVPQNTNPLSSYIPKTTNTTTPSFAPQTYIPTHNAPNTSQSQVSKSWNSFNNKGNNIQIQTRMLNTNKKPSVGTPTSSGVLDSAKSKQQQAFGMWNPATSTQDSFSFPQKYDPFVEDDMEISDDDDKPSQNTPKQPNTSQVPVVVKHDNEKPRDEGAMKVTSGAAFYKGLILYIPPLEQVKNTYKGSPAMKMLYASFEFSFKMQIKIETKPKENTPNVIDATVLYDDQVISTGSGWYPYVEASVRALELLSETCYTIQAKEDYFLKCKLVDGEQMKTLNLKKWEAVSQKYPKLLEITKESHIQKTFSVFLAHHTSTGVYEDIVISNITRQDVINLKNVVEFFQLTMLPCSVSTNLSKKNTPCVVTVHKYTSAQKLLEILIECGGENDKFKLYPPDTFKDFYKLHQNYWDPALQKPETKNKKGPQTTLVDEELQATILKPYKNVISEMFEKHKSLPKVAKPKEDPSKRKAGDDFMKETLQIDMSHSKNVAPVERMQLLLKYMEQLQEYGSRVLTSGRQEMIKIYHNAIDNLRKDLDTCRKDIEKEQKEKSLAVVKPEDLTRSRSTRSPRRRSPRRRSRSPTRRGQNRSSSSNKKAKSRSPKRLDRPRKSLSPRRRRSPLRKASRVSPTRRTLPLRRARSPGRRARSPRSIRSVQSTTSQEESHFVAIFHDQFKRYMDVLRKFRIEIEDTPIERRNTLKDKLSKCKEQFIKFYNEAMESPADLENYLDELEICKEELAEQSDLVAGIPGPNDMPRSLTPPPWMNVRSFEPPPTQFSYSPLSTSYPLPGPRPEYGARIPPPAGMYGSVIPGYDYPL